VRFKGRKKGVLWWEKRERGERVYVRGVVR